MLPVPLIQLQCGVNSYEWGKKGNSSRAAQFAAASLDDNEFKIDEEKPYAELWMGTHPSNPSKDKHTGRTLLELIQDNQALLSPAIAERYQNKLPFLFKVLSIQKALSIQAHPNKKLAEKLHARDPKNYPDDNHKPEMAIAISDFEGLCGFRPLKEIAHFLDNVPALRQLVGEDKAKAFAETVKRNDGNESEEAMAENKKVLQSAFGALMASSEADMTAAAEKLVQSAKSAGADFAGTTVPSPGGAKLSELVGRLYGQFGADYGLFVLFFLNFVEMKAGEAIYLRADDIHAYISGDIIECMASSDNVVRAGFTPKFKDVDNLVNMLTYDFAPIEQQKMEPTDYTQDVKNKREAGATLNQAAIDTQSEIVEYNPPIEEFSVIRSLLKSQGSKVTFKPIDGPSIIICTEGQGKISVGPKVQEIKKGHVFFVGATAECVLESEDDQFETFKAFCVLDEQSNGN
ncbi:hypothetical protein NEUTE1DRAFT_119344 [Neurospora tetrasperma FGSC 2508]|uniref:Mannose-6-phosphate isomerase n=1 Tax=Neurospora tetrasperma (strain FGSC 2508 / ATCC MYA-4615 / P0657) TaxID=510951 RepID=F8MEZ4_NEUT8|nr:uncharacterized protein NEUTE1DRAFT_119344 [Neurospora tetrasperma FGSC 2508]EGO60046.1 hypothetical protein NEUTE1DRAFT_119344 [Neurospora tetrasperma FGSC 2508]EGZ76005.1 putative phosphomannose isomerase [Neurospora tetrasperma FGSC 2509]